jgi:hypothetical protein
MSRLQFSSSVIQALGEEWPLKRSTKILGNGQGMGGNLKPVSGMKNFCEEAGKR